MRNGRDSCGTDIENALRLRSCPARTKTLRDFCNRSGLVKLLSPQLSLQVVPRADTEIYRERVRVRVRDNGQLSITNADRI